LLLKNKNILQHKDLVAKNILNKLKNAEFKFSKIYIYCAAVHGVATLNILQKNKFKVTSLVDDNLDIEKQTFVNVDVISGKSFLKIKKQQRSKILIVVCQQNIKTFDEARDIYFLPENSAGLKWHNKVVEKYNKKHITPYLDPTVKDYFYQFNWEELNNPIQKHHIRNAFPELLSFGKIRKHTNLHLGAGVDKLFESLLNNSKINFNDRKRMMDVSKDWYKKEFKI